MQTGPRDEIDTRVSAVSVQKVQSSARTSVSSESPTFGQDGIGLRSDDLSKAGFGRYWRGLRTSTQLFLITAMIVSASMAVLGYLVNTQARAGYLQSVAESGAIYVTSFLGPLTQEFDDAGNPSPIVTEKLDRLLSTTRLGDRIEKINIFRRDGVVVYSTDKTLVGKNFLSRAMVQAFAGEAVFRVLKDIDADQAPDLELYEPVYRHGSDDVFIVAELFINSGFFERELVRLQFFNWLFVIGMTIVVLGLLFLAVLRSNRIIEGQQSALNLKLAEAEALSDVNRTLRDEADALRVQASQQNEELLRRIGADLHDGPVQLLSLLTLKLGTAAGRPLASRDKSELDPGSIARRALAELREISTGLVLPEIANIPLEAALRLAVKQHENLTGTRVACGIVAPLPDPVPHSLKICLYRVVQEALNNAVRHAGGRGQCVGAHSDAKSIVVTIGDGGRGIEFAAPDPPEHAYGGLGLHGIDSRVRAFGGTMQIRPRECGGTEIVVTIPHTRTEN